MFFFIFFSLWFHSYDNFDDWFYPLFFCHWRFFLMTSVWFVCDFFMGFLTQKLLTERLKMKETLQNSNWFHDLQTEVITRIADSSQKCWNCWNIWQLKRTHKKIIRPSQENKNIMNIRKSYEHQKIIWTSEKSYENHMKSDVIWKSSKKYMEISTCQNTDFLWCSYDFSQLSRFQVKIRRFILVSVNMKEPMQTSNSKNRQIPVRNTKCCKNKHKKLIRELYNT